MGWQSTSHARGLAEPALRRQFIRAQVILRRNAESIRNAIKKCEHRRDVNRLGDLILAPSGITQFLHVGVRGAGSAFGHFLDVVEQHTLGRRKPGFVKLAFQNRRNALTGGSLNTQEVGMRVQSIRAAVQKRNVAGDHLLVAAC
jgi:hypothetical protein